jgi:uncharacterized membrane protein
MDPGGIIMGSIGLLMLGPVAYWVTKAASSGGIEVNSVIGIRTRRSNSSQRAWEAAHRAAPPYTLVACILALTPAVFSVTAVALVTIVGASRTAPIVLLVSGYVGFLIVMLLATRAGNRAVQALPSPS